MEINKIREQIKETMFSEGSLTNFQNERLKSICEDWSSSNSANSKIILDNINQGNDLLFWNKITEYSRFSNNSHLIHNTKNSIREISSSGSSGDRLNYHISLEWRLAHHAVWELAYKHLSNQKLNNYLDTNAYWAMARPFGGKLDSLPNQLECVPTSDGIDYQNGDLTTDINVVHGAITTILEMLENKVVQKWKPSFVILTYEKPLDWQKEIIKSYWSKCEIHEEYGSNDGGVSAFTCQNGNLHYWTSRSLFNINNNGNLVCLDLWNNASCFIGYNNGDEIQQLNNYCNCGLIYPIVKVNGRASGNIILDNKKKIPSLGPFSPFAMKGIAGIRIYIEANDKAVINYVPLNKSEVDFKLINTELEQFCFRNIQFKEIPSIFELRKGCKRKFSIVQDNRIIT
jgi:hypothetical protein